MRISVTIILLLIWELATSCSNINPKIEAIHNKANQYPNASIDKNDDILSKDAFNSSKNYHYLLNDWSNGRIMSVYNKNPDY